MCWFNMNRPSGSRLDPLVVEKVVGVTEGSFAKNTWPWLRALTRFAPRLGISVLNQVVSSGANFALGLYLVRVLAPAEFGVFGICMALCLLYAGFGNALFLTQMVVHLPEKPAEDRPRYAATLLALLGAFCLATLAFAVVLHSLAGLTRSSADGGGGLILATAAASVANLLRNYFVRLAYSTSEERKALAVNLAWALVLGIALFVVHGSGGLSGAAEGLWVFAAASCGAAILGLGIARLPIATVGAMCMRHDFVEALAGGRWAMGGVGVTWLQSQSYMYVTAILIGPAGVALANAARMLIAPFTFLLPALTQLAFPRLVEMRAADSGKMLRYGLLYSRILVGLGVCYVIVLGLGARYLIPLLIGENYSLEQLLPVAAVWGLVMLLQLSKEGASLVLQALKKFRNLMFASTITAIGSIAATAAMAIPLGVSGAVLGVSVGEALLAAILWKQIRRGKHRHSN